MNEEIKNGLGDLAEPAAAATADASTVTLAPQDPPQAASATALEELQLALMKDMPTVTEMKSGAPASIQKQLNWQRATAHVQTQYLEMRLKDQTIPSIERLRKP